MTDTIAEAVSTDEAAAPLDPTQLYAVPVDVLNALVGYLLERPWREVNHLLRAVEGVQTLDELS